MKLFTIGSSGKTSEKFFQAMIDNNVKTVIDIRLKPNGGLLGFTKKQDLPYLLKTIADIEYVYREDCAPTKDLLNGYQIEKITWSEYRKHYLKTIKDRDVIGGFTKKLLNRACLLCSELEPDHCHRKILAEYLAKNYEGIVVAHL